MPVCSIVMCKHRSGLFNLTRGGISYHRFPRDPILRAQWVGTTGRPSWWSPSTVATICSQHFEPHDFVKKVGKRHYLSNNAVPSLFVAAPKENVTSRNQAETYVDIPPQADNVQFSDIYSQENRNDAITSIEVEIMPENQIILHPHRTNVPDKAHNDKKVIELMRTKIQEQELLIRKLQVRNYRLKKRLFSLKSMES